MKGGFPVNFEIFLAVFWLTYWVYILAGGLALVFFIALSKALASRTSREEPDLSTLKSFVYLGAGILTLFNMGFAVMGGYAAFFAVAVLWLLLDYVLVIAIEKRIVPWREARDLIFPYWFAWDGRLIVQSYRLRWHLNRGGTEEEFFAAEEKKANAPKPKAWKIYAVVILLSVVFTMIIGLLTN